MANMPYFMRLLWLFRILNKPVTRCCVGLVLLSGCALNQSRDENLILEQRVASLENEVRQLQDANRKLTAAYANFNQQDRDAELAALLGKRQQLLKTYTRQHPTIKLLDLRIKALSLSGSH